MDHRVYPGVLKEKYFQEFADRLKIAIVGFTGSTDLGDDTRQWSEEPASDDAYIRIDLKRRRKSIIWIFAGSRSLAVRREFWSRPIFARVTLNRMRGRIWLPVREKVDLNRGERAD